MAGALPVLSIFMPAYDAGEYLESVIARVPSDVWAIVRNFWIIDDGSKDDTPRVVEALARNHPRIKTVRFPENRGYGAAAKQGLALCKDDGCDAACCLHADGQYPPEEIASFARTMVDKKYDILQGSRLASGTALSGGMPQYKYAAGNVLTFFENLVFGLGMTDYHSGFLFYSRKALETIPFERLSGSFDFDLEVIATACAQKLSVGELPIPTRYAGEISHLNPVGYGLRVLGVMAKYLAGGYRV